jgi:hypothetical protein
MKIPSPHTNTISTCHIILCHINVSFTVDGNGIGAHSPTELAKHAAVKHTLGLLEKTQYSIFHLLSNVTTRKKYELKNKPIN